MSLLLLFRPRTSSTPTEAEDGFEIVIKDYLKKKKKKLEEEKPKELSQIEEISEPTTEEVKVVKEKIASDALFKQFVLEELNRVAKAKTEIANLENNIRALEELVIKQQILQIHLNKIKEEEEDNEILLLIATNLI